MKKKRMRNKKNISVKAHKKRKRIIRDRQKVAQNVSPVVEKYWFQRYNLFSKYDEGIKMDEEGWYSVTPEQIAIRHALRCVAATAKSNPVVIDCFAGVGGNAIQFARTCCSVVAIDIDPKKLEFAINNAKIYGVQHCIDFIVGDFFQLAPSLKADTTACNVVISLFCEKGDMAMAEELMNEMGLSDIYPDMILYVTMIKGFCNVGRLEDACGLVKFMRGLGCVRNLVVYLTLLYERGSMERALELLGEMEKEVGNCSPHVVTYTSVMQNFCEKGQTMEALENLDRTEAFGCAPNRVTVSALINGFCMEGHVEKAYKVIDKIVAGGNASYGDCYSSLILSCKISKTRGGREVH